MQIMLGDEEQHFDRDLPPLASLVPMDRDGSSLSGRVRFQTNERIM